MVVAIVGILAAIGGSMMTDLLPRFRTKRAAEEFKAHLELARRRAVAEGVQYRVSLIAGDPDLGGSSGSVGTYAIQRGDRESGSTTWDTLPVDLGGADVSTNEGYIDISEGSENAIPGASIEPWSAMSGGDGDDIVFSPRGFVENPASDFGADGYISVTFVNKRALQEGVTDEQVVRIARTGLVRVDSTFSGSTAGAQGVEVTSTWGGSAASGHSP